MPLPTQVKTARLLLRPPAVTDAAVIFSAWASDTLATRYMSWRRHESLSDTLAFLEFARDEWDKWPAGPYLVELQSTGSLIGSCGFAFRSPDVAEVGYILAREHWGHGYATEALSAQLAVSEAVAPLRLVSAVHPDNIPSHRVLAKCGFVRGVPGRVQARFPNLGDGEREDALSYVREIGV